ncbi:uncharacterized protein FIBRA_07266 [Fibroporia radiculosa]|uniref:Uncharacterized protein n=1 Tax=Fibroporia radiculosa TaxID=599839 RepID=J4GUL5_9APHY|nr:uncharacterized protein FIBRA_07266 [Fibroporia radiculosa]CCM05060.1 predicted protein [Fibroporia radiculosa]
MKEYWDQVCPEPTVIKVEDVIESFGDVETTAASLVEKWVELLDKIEDPCVEVEKNPRQVFELWVMQDAKRLLDVWPSFSQSPIMTEFGWSSLVELGFDTNRELFAPSTGIEPYLSSLPHTVSNAQRYTVIPGLLVLHIRRGDFVRHCKRIAEWQARFFGYNAFPSMPDEDGVPRDLAPSLKEERYRIRCYPEIDDIVKKIEEVRNTDAGRGLRNAYIMTNAPGEWVADLERALQRAWSWDSVTNSRELLVNPEQEYVKQAVDVLIGQRAQVFIGNGWSSLSGQVSMLRMANDFPPASTRMW